MKIALRTIGTLVALALALTIGAMPVAAQAAPKGGGDFSTLAWECSVGDLCVWNGLDGTGSRCSWTNSDPDWFLGSIRCSWADAGQAVFSVWNRGANPAYKGVCLYDRWNYEGFGYFIPQGAWQSPVGNHFRSHRWVTTNGC